VRTEPTKAALIRRRFARRPEEVAAARRFVRSGLTRGSDAWETAQLLVSETVTSSLDQSAPGRGSGTLEVGYAMDGRKLRVEVSDDGGPARLPPHPRRPLGRRPRSGAGPGSGQPLGGARELVGADHLVRGRHQRRMTVRSRTLSSAPTAVTASDPLRTSTAVKWWRTSPAARSGEPVAQASSG
jgi:hypothetical protein